MAFLCGGGMKQVEWPMTARLLNEWNLHHFHDHVATEFCPLLDQEIAKVVVNRVGGLSKNARGNCE